MALGSRQLIEFLPLCPNSSQQRKRGRKERGACVSNLLSSSLVFLEHLPINFFLESHLPSLTEERLGNILLNYFLTWADCQKKNRVSFPKEEGKKRNKWQSLAIGCLLCFYLYGKLRNIDNQSCSSVISLI
jgi:hypothetical protein